ncbi:beta strand repeat-containing protein [Luteolibacter marinus]|uniref:beta strand repeat-containing protein n=1 Tax=Luteolibacter marinus TaxID=2776705 RepID=UPI00186745FE|nr:hypothetical protein [Luteolibacter marinus]
MRQRLLNTAALVGMASAAYGQTWTNGGGDQLWENGSNWSGGVVPQTGLLYINTATPGQTPILSSAVELKSADSFIGQGAGISGVLDINAGGSVDTSTKWMFIGDAGGTGTVNVNAGGSLSSDNLLRLGNGGGTGFLNIAAGGVVNVAGASNLSATSKISITGDGSLTTTANNRDIQNLTATSFTGLISSGRDVEFDTITSDVSGGTVSAGGQIFIGRGETGQLDLNSGEIGSGAWLVVGIGAGGNGTFNVNDGTINSSQTSGFTTIGADGGTGVVNQSGGTWTEFNKTILGENANGSGSYYLTGGIHQTGAIETGGGTGYFELNGGTLRAGRNESNFINATTSVVVGSSGGAIDTNGFDVSSNADLTGTGALAKQGGGSLNLAGAANSLGSVSVSAGTLFISGALGTTDGVLVGAGAAIGAGDLDGGALTGDLEIAAGGLIDISRGLLLVSSGTVTFGDFGFGDIVGFDVNSAANGTYTLIDGDFTLDSSNIANFGEGNALDLGGGRFAYFGEGSLTAIVVPEPSIALLGGFGLLGLLRRRRA